MIGKVNETDCVKELFAGWEETLIWSCLQGVMGDVYADLEEPRGKPRSAAAVLGDFTFFAGEADGELVRYRPRRAGAGELHIGPAAEPSMTIMVPRDRQWADLIEGIYQDRAKKTERYAIKKEPDVFDREHLTRIVENLDAAYDLRRIDEPLYRQCLERTWSKDLVSQFATYDRYADCGLGFVALKDGEIVSGASSYSAYRQGIEIEIDTREDYRRRGLALACGARLILECLDRGLYPSWDAQNKASVALAQKLGYHYSHTYDAYEVYF